MHMHDQKNSFKKKYLSKKLNLKKKNYLEKRYDIVRRLIWHKDRVIKNTKDRINELFIGKKCNQHLEILWNKIIQNTKNATMFLLLVFFLIAQSF